MQYTAKISYLFNMEEQEFKFCILGSLIKMKLQLYGENHANGEGYNDLRMCQRGNRVWTQ